MWCPSCGAEYRPGFTRCPDCDVDLVAEPPPKPEPERRLPDAVSVASLGPEPAEVFVGPAVAVDMMRSVLEGSGIDCLILKSGLEAYGAGLMPQRILVRGEDGERAGEIILAARTGELEIDETMGDDLDEDTVLYEEEPPGWIEGSSSGLGGGMNPTATGPISETEPWWRHPQLPQLLSAVMVLFGIAAVVGLAYLLFMAMAD